MLLLLVVAAASLFMLVASAYDLKYGEIPDRVNFAFSLVMVAAAVALSFQASDYGILLNTLSVGFGYFAVAYVLYLLGQWGGGDVKLLLGLGCALGLLNSLGFQWNAPFMPYYILYFIDMGLVVMPYALVYMLLLSISRPEVFGVFWFNAKKAKTFFHLFLAVTLPIVLYGLSGFSFFLLFSLLLPLFVLSSIFLKTSEDVLLTKAVDVSRLSEGDALAEDLYVEGKAIALRRQIEGVDGKQLELIRALAVENKIPSRLKIRWGVKFAPIILVSFLLAVRFGDLMALLIRYSSRLV